MATISIKNKIFKQFKDTKYYCDEDGNIYSDYSQKILKPMKRGKGNKQYLYIDINFGQGQKHYYVHKIVYETWIGEIPLNMEVLHKDDDQFNNNINNLYLGNQSQNIDDCKENNHRMGNTWILTIYDNKVDKTLTFCPAKNFIEYCGHPSKSGSVKKFFDKNWFNARYKIIDYYLCKSLDIKEGVTTIPDECKEVGGILSPIEARSTQKSEEIV